MKKTIKNLYNSLSRKIDKYKVINIPTEFHGDENYGGWYIYPGNLSANSIVYSFGVGEDASFDLSLIDKYDLQVFAFDPTPKSIQWVEGQEWPEEFNFIPVGLADFNGKTKFYLPEKPEYVSHSIVAIHGDEESYIEVEMKRLVDFMKELGHTKIDILKMDIEGAEYAVIDDILRKDNPLRIDQILVEFHHFFEEIEEIQTYHAINKILKHRYKIFYISPARKEYCFIFDNNS
jgi:FkbM family methyltransferase